ncbi:MAG: beta-ketoacyl synthase N-terminal-like domain-containing protein, partial [Planctomycetaceae bacterium]|nr:beta-ketoacyl synthase N-terminal-like domain-containing protein [Planctomycetaceae bacterium]
GAGTVAEFWDNVARGVDNGRDVPAGRWHLSPDAAYLPGTPQPDRVYSKWGCFLDDVPDGFPGLTLDRETLSTLDPLVRIGLKAAADAVRDARTPSVDPLRAGVIFGHIVLPTESTSALARDVLLRGFARQVLLAPEAGEKGQSEWSGRNWTAAALPAGIIANALGWQGTAYTLDAACASSLYALKLASDELLSHRADVMLAGGLSRPDCQYTQMGFAALQALSKRGRCAPLSAEADGLIVGEGAGLFVLKRLSDAVRDGDRIYATIAGIGLSNDRGANLLAPRSEGQLRAMQSAYHLAGWRPGDVDLIECHATGTPVGDAVELDSLHTLWREEPGSSRRCVLGSVKSNVGHLLTAAGGASLMKLLFALQTKTLPPTANFVEPAPALNRVDSPFRVLSQAESWPQRDSATPRRAAINAFGFGGINAHVLLEEWTSDLVAADDILAPSPPSSGERAGVRGRALERPPIPTRSVSEGERSLPPMSNERSPSLTLRASVETPTSLEAPGPLTLTLSPEAGARGPSEEASADAVAIIGLGTHVGPWSSLRDVQERLFGARKDVVQHRTTGWGIAATPSARAGFAIDEVRTPLGAFRIPPVELEEMLPQQQLMLLVTAAALDDAGLPRDLGDRTGVFVGIGLDPNTTNFHCRWSIAESAPAWAKQLGLSLDGEQLDDWVRELRDAFGPPLTANRVMGNLGGIVASRLAREFDVGGPSFTVSSDAASGVHALQIAMRALQRGELDRAIVGAVDLPSDIRRQLQPAGDEDTAQPFADAAVAVIVKRHADAVRDGDRIYAVLHDFSQASREHQRPESETVLIVGDSLLAPSPPSSGERVGVRGRALDRPSIPTRSVSEGERSLPPASNERPSSLTLRAGVPTPTPRVASDPLTLTLSPEAGARGPEKTTAGLVAEPVAECGAATGLLNVVQAALALHQQVLPPGQSVAADADRATEHQFWLRDRCHGPRRAVVEMATASGSVASLALEEASAPEAARATIERRQPLGEFPAALFVFDGNDADELRAAMRDCRTMLPDRGLIERAAREWFRHRPLDASRRLAAAVLASDLDELRATLDNLPQRIAEANTLNEPRVWFDPQPLGRDGRLAFVFPGSGNHFLGMGRELLTAWPEMLRRQDAENERLRSQYGPDLIWNGPSTEALGRDHKRMIFGQVALGTAVCDWLSLFGIRPHSAIGYSLGESAALFGLRAWTDRDEMLARMEQSALFGGDLTFPFDAARQAWDIPADEAVPWLSGVIDRSADVVRPALGQHPQAYLLIVNTPAQCVIGGRRNQVEQLVRELDAQFVPFPAPSTVHCEVLKEVAKAYTELHRMTTQVPEGVTVYSSATGRPYGLSREACAEAILAQAVGTVDFPQVIEKAYADGVRLFVEIGPGSSCTKMIDEILGDRPHWVRPVTPATADPVTHALRVLGELIVQRVPVDLTVLYGGETALPSHRPETAPPTCVVTPTQGARWQIPRSPGIAIPGRRTPAPTTAPQPAPAPLPPSAPRRSSHAAPVVEAMPMSARTSVAQPVSASAPSAVADWDEWMTERIAAHEAFLRFSEQVQSLAGDMVLRGDVVVSAPTVPKTAKPASGPPPAVIRPEPISVRASKSSLALNPQLSTLDYSQCLEFAIGSIGNVLGPKFAEIDSFLTRVRLPDVPLMLVDRILEIEGEPLSMTHGRVVTEHDIHADDWYLDCGRIPTCLAVESGQADLFLSGWLGIDFQTRGLASYRLLDAVVTFHDALPGPGNTIHYDIRINGFFRQGETYLFRFEFDATVNGNPLLTMRDGCAGFFTMAELAAGQGIVHTAIDKQPRPGVRPDDWDDPVPMTVESYNDDQLAALRAGDLVACFGPAFSRLRLRAPVTLPSGRLNLVHRVLQLDPSAGKYGLGQIRAEADIHPDDWFLTCHFCDDQVMPGTLMYECCLHTLRIYLLRMGWIGDAGQVAYEPVPGVKSRLKCRGQVLASTQKVWYEVTLKEIGYGSPGIAIPGRRADSAPYCLADALMYADGKPIVEITDMSVRLSSLTRDDIDRLWSGDHACAAPDAQGLLSLGFPPSTIDAQPLFDTARITEFAIGKPSRAFGDRYRIFDEGRVIARLPGPPFQFLDRITSIKDCEPWQLAAGGVIEAQYDVPPEAWYFAANRQRRMPYAVLLEAALQPCGWLAGYLGSALTSDVDLSFRNLGGKATQFRDVTPDSGTLTTTVKITRVSQSAGMIIQHYDFDLRQNGEPVYVGNTYFGFFAKAALANQVGIRDAGV